MALLSVQDVPVVGEDAVTFSPADVAGDTMPAVAGGVVLVRNGSGVAVSVTVTTPGTVEGLAIQDPAVSVAAGATGAFPLVSRVFGATVAVLCAPVTSVTVAALRPAR